MQKKCFIYFLILFFIGSSLQSAQQLPLSEKQIDEIQKWLREEPGIEEDPKVFVYGGNYYPLTSDESIVLPVDKAHELLKRGENIVSVLEAQKRGISNISKRNSTKFSIIGSLNYIEVLTIHNKVFCLPLGSREDINIPSSLLNKVLAYKNCDERKKRALAFIIARQLESNALAADQWCKRAIKRQSFVARAYLADLLGKQVANLPEDDESVDRVLVHRVRKDTYRRLVQEKGHLGSMLALAQLHEEGWKFMKAIEWYKRAICEKGHTSSIKDMIRCIDMLWEPWALDEQAAPEKSLLESIQELYGLAAYKFGNEEAVNKLADLMKECDYGTGDEEDLHALEKRVLVEYMKACPKPTDNIMLRLALLEEESYKVDCDKDKREWSKVYQMFLLAGQAGNFPAMIKLHQLALKAGDKEKTQLWSNRINTFYGHIFVTSDIQDSLLYLAYLGSLGEKLLKSACLALGGISSEPFEEAALDYSFEPSVDPAMSRLPSIEPSTVSLDKDGHLKLEDMDSEYFEEPALDYASEPACSSALSGKKRKREKSESACSSSAPLDKRMKNEKSEPE